MLYQETPLRTRLLLVVVTLCSLTIATSAQNKIDYVGQIKNKPVIDVRERGIQCNTGTDQSTAFNTLLANISNTEIDIPYNCQIRVDTQLSIFGQTSWVIRGLGAWPALGGFNGPAIYGCNGATGSVLYINRSAFGRITGLGVYSHGPSAICASASFTKSITIDNTGATGLATQHIEIDHSSFVTNPQGGSVSGYMGVEVTSVTGNLNSMKFEHNWIHCQNSANSYGIRIGSSTSDDDVARDNEIDNCFQGIRLETGNIAIDKNIFTSDGAYSLFGTNGAAIYLGGCTSGPVNISYNEETGGGPFLNSNNDTNGGCSNGENLIGNEMGVSDINTLQYAVNLGTANGRHLMIGNDIYIFGSPATTVAAVGSNSQSCPSFGPLGTFIDIANVNRFPSNSAQWSGCVSGPDFQFGHDQLWSSSDGTGATAGLIKLLSGISAGGTLSLGAGGSIVYRCSVAGTLRVGQLTTVSGDCGTAIDTGLRTP